jgi:hypothetical protein
MKPTSMALSAALFLAAVVTNAGAIECAEGVHRAGCVEKGGAVVVDKPVHEEAVVPKAEVVEPRKVEPVPGAAVREDCRMVEGRRVCR